MFNMGNKKKKKGEVALPMNATEMQEYLSDELVRLTALIKKNGLDMSFSATFAIRAEDGVLQSSSEAIQATPLVCHYHQATLDKQSSNMKEKTTEAIGNALAAGEDLLDMHNEVSSIMDSMKNHDGRMDEAIALMENISDELLSKRDAPKPE